ncbi:protein spire homolog 1-like [Dendropsophus ebraccatus]|uniref:protein spire homolog 1-like n=1 Tax=Dendropsophus ebraccatus TaxID=150705 RepID=UPI003831718D
MDGLLQTIQLSKQGLKRLSSHEELEEDVLVMCDNWGAMWSRVMNELRLGVSLRRVDQRLYTALPVQYQLTPYELLMDDIRAKRSALRPVEIPIRQSPRCEEDPVSTGDNLDMAWNKVMNEVRLGVSLRRVDQRLYTALPLEYKLTPYELLMDDIRAKRYVLRPVKECDQNKSSKSEDAILDLIRTHTLKPASARKLKERSQEEPSLHDLLMSEIKSSKTLRSTSDIHRTALQGEEFKLSSNLFSVQRDYSLHSCRTGNRWSRPPAVDLVDNAIDVRISLHPDVSLESSSERRFSNLTSSSTDLSFFPVLTSSQVDLRMNSMSSCDQMSYTHRRSNSYEGSFQGSSCKQSLYTPRIPLPPTVSELISVRRTMVKMEMLMLASSKDFPGYKVCSSCYRKRHFFSWLFSCKVCDRTICPECHIEMLMPFKQCMHLPISFFKALVLSRGDDPFSKAQRKQMLYREVKRWDYSSVPLIFDPKDEADDHSFVKRITHDWTCIDTCIKCEEYILDVLDKSHERKFPSSFLKSRSMSESFAILGRH